MKVTIITIENGAIETGTIETNMKGYLKCMQELIDGNYNMSTVSIINGHVTITVRGEEYVR